MLLELELELLLLELLFVAVAGVKSRNATRGEFSVCGANWELVGTKFLSYVLNRNQEKQIKRERNAKAHSIIIVLVITAERAENLPISIFLIFFFENFIKKNRCTMSLSQEISPSSYQISTICNSNFPRESSEYVLKERFVMKKEDLSRIFSWEEATLEEIEEEFFDFPDFSLAMNQIFVKGIKKDSGETWFDVKRSSNKENGIEIRRQLFKNQDELFAHLSTTGKRQPSSLVRITFLVQTKSWEYQGTKIVLSTTEFEEGDVHSSISVSTNPQARPFTKSQIQDFSQKLQSLSQGIEYGFTRSKLFEYFFRYRKDVHDKLLATGIEKSKKYNSEPVFFFNKSHSKTKQNDPDFHAGRALAKAFGESGEALDSSWFEE